MLGNQGDVWTDAKLNDKNIPMSPSESANGSDGSDGSDGFRMAAVYSEKGFLGGPGCRLFYHTQNKTKKWVQEWIWDQTNDNWAEGSRIYDVPPNSHLSATIDDSSQTLRLFYVNVTERGQCLQYSNTNITQADQAYKKGAFCGVAARFLAD